MSKFEQILSFITVVEENSFAGAARRLGISTPAISRQITRLEKQLKTDLLTRTTRQVSLTEIGARYFDHCKKTLTELSVAESHIAEAQTEATGILTITSSRYFAIRHIFPHLDEFLEQNPKLRVKLELAERFPNLAAENIDILFGVSADGPEELVRKRVATTRYVLCASPKYLEKFGTPKRPSDLKKHRYITHLMRTPNNLVNFKNNKEIFVEPYLWLNDSRAMRGCALNGMGIVKLHDYVVAEELNRGELIEILAKFQEPKQFVYLYYQQSRHLLPKIRRFIDFYNDKI